MCPQNSFACNFGLVGHIILYNHQSVILPNYYKLLSFQSYNNCYNFNNNIKFYYLYYLHYHNYFVLNEISIMYFTFSVTIKL